MCILSLACSSCDGLLVDGAQGSDGDATYHPNTADGAHAPVTADGGLIVPDALSIEASIEGGIEARDAQPLPLDIERGLVAVPLVDSKVYLGWRLLPDDPEDISFDVYRLSASSGVEVKCNAEPIIKTTDFIDDPPPGEHNWILRSMTATGGRTRTPAASLLSRSESRPFLSVAIGDKVQLRSVGVGDLDGDGRKDFVVKHPNVNVDPYVDYWERSTGTFKIDAFGSDGSFLWRRDLGWSIEQGTWYSPYVVADLDLDGRAEVITKTGEGDPRDEDGRVTSGPEHITVLDGATGAVVAQSPWPSREGFAQYNYYSRNQLGVAMLDGNRPHLIVERGTYRRIKVRAYVYDNGKLREVWRWSNEGLPNSYSGQGAHRIVAADVDADGRDEVIIGSVVLDDDGEPLWTTGFGHPDHVYVGDIDPSREGLEIYYGIERSRSRNGMCLVAADTGKVIWGYSKSTKHIHSTGLCSDLTAEHPGLECYSGEKSDSTARWLWSAGGEELPRRNVGPSLGPRAAYWDADVQRELIIDGRVVDYGGAVVSKTIEGKVLAVADILGDWREEILAAVDGELRVYSTTERASDRRPWLLSDPLYRASVVGLTSGYYHLPLTSYDLATSRQPAP